MERIRDTYLETIETLISFQGKHVLEVGCGNGSRTVQIAERCREIVAIDPNEALIDEAKRVHKISNGSYQKGSADQLVFDTHSFDIVFFTLSFHHVPIDRMSKAIDEALRVLKQDGYIIFLEPSFSGSFFDAEIFFDACDGDERKQKALAYATMLSHKGLRELAELSDETVFLFDGLEDFVRSMNPKKHQDALVAFLEKHSYTLTAEQRISVFSPTEGVHSKKL